MEKLSEISIRRQITLKLILIKKIMNTHFSIRALGLFFFFLVCGNTNAQIQVSVGAMDMEYTFTEETWINHVHYKAIEPNQATVIDFDKDFHDTVNIAPNVEMNGKTFTVTAIGTYTGYHGDCNLKCSRLILPETLREIREFAFLKASIKSVKIPGSVKVIRHDAFAGCRLEEVTFEEGLQAIHSRAFNGTNITNLALPKNMNFICDDAFGNCLNLETVILPDTLKEIGERVFDSDQNLNSITLPSKMSNDLKMPLFNGCDNLKEIISPSKVPLKIVGSFDCKEDVVLKVPRGAKKRYQKADGWNKFLKIKDK